MMTPREQVCKACDGTGLQADDENWQYKCPVCGGDGILDLEGNYETARTVAVDENNRVLD
ncbi:DnaJ-class molecular chaperone [Pullulanibacillus pueri]|uniref:Uncharacterized protein n=1 Tax=Pullulanibacillus pueri TaxID=1437324 RepID=A0A8J2ZX47_9BACL|nr:hypothetical protein [Pullulanibacillus pueri]MBM7683594.1 DnaJ-class molecular chaperone [Pullulanibacillus pueri]GGH84536.1 hypothetical protein GCM10007096_27840 [Pullulanibacillus pueri]